MYAATVHYISRPTERHAASRDDNNSNNKQQEGGGRSGRNYYYIYEVLYSCSSGRQHSSYSSREAERLIIPSIYMYIYYEQLTDQQHTHNRTRAQFFETALRLTTTCSYRRSGWVRSLFGCAAYSKRWVCI